MEVKLIKNEDLSGWDQFIKSHPQSSLFHTSEWKSILEKTFGFKAKFIAAYEGSDIIDGLPLFLVSFLGLGKKLICIPQSGFYSAFLSDHAEAQNLLIKAAINMARNEGVRYLEIRSNAPIEALAMHDFILRHPYYFPNLELIDVSTNQNAMSKLHRRNVNKAKKLGVSVELSGRKLDLKKFYAMLEEMYREYGTPIFNFSFLNNMWENLVPKDLFFLLLVKHKKNIIGGGCFYHFNDVVTYKYGTCLKSSLAVRPYNALMWKAIMLGIERKARYFNFGATSIGDEGLLRFKKGWGANDCKGYFYYLPVKGKPPKIEDYLDSYKLAKKIWCHLPKAYLRMIGQNAYKWLC